MLVAPLAFLPVVSRLVEAMHALVNQATKHKTVNGAYVSLVKYWICSVFWICLQGRNRNRFEMCRYGAMGGQAFMAPLGPGRAHLSGPALGAMGRDTSIGGPSWAHPSRMSRPGW